MSRSVIYLKDKRFGRLLVIKQSKNTEDGKIRWYCMCDCGNEKIVRGDTLRSGRIKSCGCLHKEIITTHGHCANKQESKTYNTWASMNKRCDIPENIGYKYYGGRNIKVCYHWSNKNPKGFENFLKDMGERPKDKTLDRINNDGNYEPGNCHWATIKEQAINKRNNKLWK